MFRREGRTALPVVDAQGVLIGIVTVDDGLDAAQEMATRDLQRFGGSEALGEPYMAISLPKMIRKRAGWLVVLFLGEMLTATAMGFFEEEIARAVVLALFVPLIISSGGNSGSQASTLVIRALALGEIGLRDWWRVARRELVSGVSLGGILAAIGFARIAGWSMFTDLYGPHWLLVALTVGLTLVGVVLWGTLVGSMLPFALRRLGFDPASLVGAVRGDARRRHRPGDLLLGRHRHPAGHAAVSERVPISLGGRRSRAGSRPTAR